MNDKAFNEKISLISSHASSSKFEEAVQVVNELRIRLLPNDLAAYLSIKSITEDIGTNKNPDYIRKDIEEIKQKIINQRIPIKEKISNFVIAIVSYTLIPIIPFVANWLNNEENTNKDIVLSFAMYCISISLSFKTARDRILGILFSLIIFLLVDKEPKQGAVLGTYLLTFVTIVFHVFDRVNRHIKDNEPFI